MENLHKLFDAEHKFMKIVWQHQPVNSTELTRICQRELGWKKPTTYSMIKKLCERGIMKNEKATVTALITREEVQRYEADAIMDKVFNGSMPSFVTAFLQGKTLSQEDARQIKSMIDGVTK
ncbi:MAG: BlaI/MecI/CopY family transcriptional regulator [Firmicutes bacterium]|nr:BlaI/MecI/CopY family transcriptional regulator [Bacillota bacterium]